MITINIRCFANGQNSKWFLFHIYIYMIYFDFESASLKSIMRLFVLFSTEYFLLLCWSVKLHNTVRVTAAEAPGGSAYSNYFGGTLMKRNLVVLTK